MRPTLRSSSSLPLMQPQGSTPMSGTVSPCRATVCPTNFITPVSLPRVKIQALADVAAVKGAVVRTVSVHAPRATGPPACRW